MMVVGWILVIGCAPTVFVLGLRRRGRATRTLRANLASALDLATTDSWPDPDIEGAESVLIGHPGVLTGLTSMGHRYWIDIDASIHPPSPVGHVALAIELEDGLDAFRITPGGAWTKQRFGGRSDVFAQRFAVTGVSALDPTLKHVLTEATPTAVEVPGPILTMVFSADGRHASPADIDRLLNVSQAIVDAFGATSPGVPTRAGTIDASAISEAHLPKTLRRAELLAALGLAVGVALVLFG